MSGCLTFYGSRIVRFAGNVKQRVSFFPEIYLFHNFQRKLLSNITQLKQKTVGFPAPVGRLAHLRAFHSLSALFIKIPDLAALFSVDLAKLPIFTCYLINSLLYYQIEAK